MECGQRRLSLKATEVDTGHGQLQMSIFISRVAVGARLFVVAHHRFVRCMIPFSRLSPLPSFPMKQHILVVDDEVQIRDLLSLFLGKQGYVVHTAATTVETLRVATQYPLDLVVLDIGLADEDGMNLLASLKARFPSTRVIMLTGMGFVEDLLEEAQEKGADGYVSKVLPLDELLQAIRRALDAPRIAQAC